MPLSNLSGGSGRRYLSNRFPFCKKNSSQSAIDERVEPDRQKLTFFARLKRRPARRLLSGGDTGAIGAEAVNFPEGRHGLSLYINDDGCFQRQPAPATGTGKGRVSGQAGTTALKICSSSTMKSSKRTNRRRKPSITPKEQRRLWATIANKR